MGAIGQRCIIREAYARSQRPSARPGAHGGVCATESALIRSRLRGSSRKIFAKVDYRKTIGPGLATSRICGLARI
ncbi:hypothetical protein A051pD_gene0018 [Aeromonas phage A051]|uniref:Uncharacterized protein n=1 Tax=Aeromonas phage A051 TaxID=2985286 RepID=A0A9X9JSR8_9CAUD|nr:hypothetical protein A051pD_gene0018 [Aeromonas phage A051]